MSSVRSSSFHSFTAVRSQVKKPQPTLFAARRPIVTPTTTTTTICRSSKSLSERPGSSCASHGSHTLPGYAQPTKASLARTAGVTTAASTPSPTKDPKLRLQYSRSSRPTLSRASLMPVSHPAKPLNNQSVDSRATAGVSVPSLTSSRPMLVPAAAEQRQLNPSYARETQASAAKKMSLPPSVPEADRAVAPVNKSLFVEDPVAYKAPGPKVVPGYACSTQASRARDQHQPPSAAVVSSGTRQPTQEAPSFPTLTAATDMLVEALALLSSLRPPSPPAPTGPVICPALLAPRIRPLAIWTNTKVECCTSPNPVSACSGSR